MTYGLIIDPFGTVERIEVPFDLGDARKIIGYDLDVISGYLSKDAPILGVVELGFGHELLDLLVDGAGVGPVVRDRAAGSSRISHGRFPPGARGHRASGGR